jgi:hypothetical protein
VNGPGVERRTESDGVTLVPIERLGDGARRRRFAIVPPWRKAVYAQPDRTDS